MYPQRQLTALARRKAVVRLRIYTHRAQCAEAAAVATRPLQWLDLALSLWRRFGPLLKLIALPAGLVAARKSASGITLFRKVLRWAPTLIGVVSSIRQARESTQA